MIDIGDVNDNDLHTCAGECTPIQVNPFTGDANDDSSSTLAVRVYRTRSTTKYLCDRINVFDIWAIRKILRIPYTRHMTNIEVRHISGCQPLSHTITDRRLRLFGHIIRSSPNEDHHRSVASAIQKPPSDWKRPKGRPSHTWLRAIEADLKQLNIGLSSAWMKATNWEIWWRSVPFSAGHGNAQKEYAMRRRRRNCQCIWLLQQIACYAM